jgi:hypothetical protein
MKLGTLLTLSIVSLSTVGGGLALYVAATRYQTMDQVSVAQGRLAVVRAAGDIPRYLNPERGFATNILFGPPAIDPKQRAELDTYRKQTDGAADKLMELRKALSGLDDADAVASAIEALKAKLATFRDMMDKGLAAAPEARRDAAKALVAENSAFNTAVTALLDGQVRKLARLDGDAYRQATYANVAWTLRDVGGLNASIHKALVGAKRPATEAEIKDLYRSQGRTDQILLTLEDLRKNPATPPGVAAALQRMNEAYTQRFGGELKMVKDGAAAGKYEHDTDAFYVESQLGLGSIIGVRDAFYDHAEQILGSAYASARISFIIALAVLIAFAAASAGLIVMVRRRRGETSTP